MPNQLEGINYHTQPYRRVLTFCVHMLRYQKMSAGVASFYQYHMTCSIYFKTQYMYG